MLRPRRVPYLCPATLPTAPSPPAPQKPIQADVVPHGQRLDEVTSGGYLQAMRSVGLKLLKSRLSEYVRLAAGGETVLVTDRDRVVAELVPPRPGRSPLLADAVLADAVRRGWVTPAVIQAGGAVPRKPVATFRDIMREMKRDRDDR